MATGWCINVARRLVRCPWGMRMGWGSSMRRPWTIIGRSRITIGARTRILRGAYFMAVEGYAGIAHHPDIFIGDDVYIGKECYLTAMNAITIGAGCVLSDHVYITDLMHGLHPKRGLIMDQPLESKGPVSIGRDTFIGYRCTIMPGVILGNNCVVGAESVVTRSFPPFSMIVGNPAKLLRTYSQETDSWEIVRR